MEKCVSEVSFRLARKGHSVIIYSSNSPKTSYLEKNGNLTIHRMHSFFKIFGAPFAFFISILKEAPVDVVHVHIPPPFGVFFSILYSKLKHVPIVLTYHNDTFADSIFEWFFAMIYNSIQFGLILKYVSLITVPSNAYKLVLMSKKIPESKIKVVPHGYDFLSNSQQITKSNLDFKGIVDLYNLDKKKIILFVGSLELRKGLEFLIDAIPKLVQKFPNLIILIVGAGSIKEKLIFHARHLNVDDKIIFLGSLPQNLLDSLYDLADIFVLPSLYETFSLVLLEAMAHGKPVIATKILGTTALIKSGITGILVEPKNTEKLADGIIHLLVNENFAKEIGRCGKIFSKKFTWEKAVLSYEEIYKKLTST